MSSASPFGGRNVAPALAKKAVPKKAAAVKLPDTKPELVEIAIARGIPSYEAHAMTAPELKKKLEA